MQLPVIPDKLYFKIGEVSDLVGVKPYVLRYWESEFKEITPVKSSSNQRLYRRKDVELLLKIRQLLYRERYTIHGAKKILKKEPANSTNIQDEKIGQLDLILPENLKSNVVSSDESSYITDTLKELEREMSESLKLLTLT